jgi:hypothetical protein
MVALANLAIATALDAAAWVREGSNPATGMVCLFCVFNGMLYGQATVLGAAAGLIPRRSVTGLVGIATYAIVFGYATWIAHTSLSLLVTGVPFIGIFFALLALAMQILLSCGRLLLGWRIATAGSRADQPRGQFQLSDLLELTLLCAVWLGLNLVLEDHSVRGLMAVQFAKFIVQFCLIGLPVLFATLAIDPPRPRFIFGLCIWYIAVDTILALIPIYGGDSLASLARQLPRHAISSCAFLLAIACNGLWLRRIGYRWRTRRSP